MSIQDIPEFLFNEAVSNYIVFFLGAIGGIAGTLVVRRLNRARPRVILVERLFESRILGIDQEIRGRLEISYNGLPISELHEARFMIRNTGSDTIENGVISFWFEDLLPTELVEFSVTNVEEVQGFTIQAEPAEEKVATDDGEEVIDPDSTEKGHAFIIGFPFLNPYREYEDYLGVTMVATKPIVVNSITGRGLGWTTKYVDKTIYFDRVLRLMTSGAPVFVRLAYFLTAIAPRHR